MPSSIRIKRGRLARDTKAALSGEWDGGGDNMAGINMRAHDEAHLVGQGTLVQPHDGYVPSAVTLATMTAKGGVGFIAVQWNAITNNDPVTYDIYISDTTGYTPSSTTLVGSISGSLFFIKNLADGTPMSYDTTYYIQVLARDLDGASTASGEIEAQMARVSGGVGGDITAGTITAEQLNATIIMSNLFTTAISGRRVSFDTNGIYLYDSDDTPLVGIPTDSTASVFFAGNINATTMDVSGNAVFHGTNNTLDKSSVTTLLGSVSDPKSAPGFISLTTTALTLSDTDDTSTAYFYGMQYSTAGGANLNSATVYATYQHATSSARLIAEFNPTTGQSFAGRRIILADNSWTFLGFTRMGNYIYANVIHSSTGNSGLWVYDAATLALLDSSVSLNAINALAARAGMVNDGTHVYVVANQTTGAGHPVKLYAYAAYSAGVPPARAVGSDIVTDLLTPTHVTLECNGGCFVTESDVNSGNSTLWLALLNTSGTPAAAYFPFTTAGASVSAVFRPNASTSIFGIYHDGTRFYTNTGNSLVNQQSNFGKGDGYAGAAYWTGYTWYDSAGTVHQSAISPRASKTIRPREYSVITWPSIPTGGADDPDSTRLFLLKNATDPGSTLSTYYMQGSANTGTSYTLDTYDTGTAGDDTVTVFGTAATQAQISNAFPTAYAPLKGNGDGFIPIGSMMMWSTATAPTGWLLCTGDTIDSTTSTTYQGIAGTLLANLAAVIGTTFGGTDTQTAFKLPDLQQRFPIGKAASGTGSTLGGTGGNIDHTHSESSHLHGAGTLGTADHPTNTVTPTTGAAIKGTNYSHNITGNTGSTTPTGTGTGNPPFQAVNFIIKY